MATTIGDPLLDPATDPYFEGFRKGGRIRFVDAFVSGSQNALDPRQVDITIAAGGGGSLQTAYDGGETVTTDAQGAIDVTRGVLAVDDEPALALLDANANPGRTVAILRVTDQNVVGAADPDVPSVLITKDNVTQSAVLLRLQSTDPGTLGAELEMFQSSATPATSDVTARISMSGRDAAGNYVRLARLDGVLADATAGNADGRLDLAVRRLNVESRVLAIASGSAAAEGGAILNNLVAAGAVPSFTLQAISNFGAGQPIFRLTNNATAETPFQVDGDGDVTSISVSGGAVGVEHQLYQNSASPANADVVGLVTFYGNDSAANKQQYGQMDCRIVDVSTTSEDALFRWSLIEAGALNEAMRLGSTGILEVDDNAVMAAVVGLFDDYDDAMVLRRVYSPEAQADSVRKMLVDMGIATMKENGRSMVSVPKMFALLGGAAVQARKAHDALASRIADLEARLGSA